MSISADHLGYTQDEKNLRTEVIAMGRMFRNMSNVFPEGNRANELVAAVRNAIIGETQRGRRGQWVELAQMVNEIGNEVELGRVIHPNLIIEAVSSRSGLKNEVINHVDESADYVPVQLPIFADAQPAHAPG